MRLIEHTERRQGWRNWGRASMTILAVACLVAGRCWWSSAIAASAAGLAALDYLRVRWSRDAVCVLADLVLFTPLLLR